MVDAVAVAVGTMGTEAAGTWAAEMEVPGTDTFVAAPPGAVGADNRNAVDTTAAENSREDTLSVAVGARIPLALVAD